MPRHAALNGNGSITAEFSACTKAGEILFPERHINVGRNTLNRYYLSYLSGLMVGAILRVAPSVAPVIHYPRDISEFTFLLLYSVDKRDRSRYSRPVGFDLQ